MARLCHLPRDPVDDCTARVGRRLVTSRFDFVVVSLSLIDDCRYIEDADEWFRVFVRLLRCSLLYNVVRCCDARRRFIGYVRRACTFMSALPARAFLSVAAPPTRIDRNRLMFCLHAAIISRSCGVVNSAFTAVLPDMSWILVGFQALLYTHVCSN